MAIPALAGCRRGRFSSTIPTGVHTTLARAKKPSTTLPAEASASPKKKAAAKRTVPKKPVRASKKPAAKTAALARPSNWKTAVAAADSKQAQDIRVFDLRDMGGFTDFLVICHGTNPRQVQAISDEIEDHLKGVGERALSIEGYTHAEWILMDYGDFVVNVFADKARSYYDLERLWRDAKAIAV